VKKIPYALCQEDFKLATGLETPIQLLYSGILLCLLSAAGYILFRKAQVRYELGDAAKILGEKIRSGNARSPDYFELGAIMMRLKLYSQATSNLENCIKYWDYEQIELAQVYNALGFAYMETNLLDKATAAYLEAVRLQPGYTTARNNLGKIFETKKGLGALLIATKQH
jgi:tetratricopeptide (TPR) repeat protein